MAVNIFEKFQNYLTKDHLIFNFLKWLLKF